MAVGFQPEDRVIARDGLRGTVVAVDGVLITVRFDTAMHETVVATKLTKIEPGESQNSHHSVSRPA